MGTTAFVFIIFLSALAMSTSSCSTENVVTAWTVGEFSSYVWNSFPLTVPH